MLLEKRQARPGLLFAGFNYDASYLCIGTNKGYRVYSTEPLELILSREYTLDGPGLFNQPGGITCCQVLDKSNLFAFVAGGKYPKFDRQSVVVWDDEKQCIVFQLDFNAVVKQVWLKDEWYLLLT